ncbi:MAG: hypothetical protein R6V72_01425 [Cyclobacterium sp.]|uniref:hypothetical protein n=1 Tax=unclassified Cyclobacterium TaxID=2615055 RepID=UPI0013D271E8|nr:hypothetical protein [Cyclobacterium sp. SYSU L10401]
MKTTVFTFVLGLLFFSCMENEDLSALGSEPFPVGNWSNLNYQENGFAMEKVNQLQENTYGYRFLSDGKLIHRANSGWCGTPPIVTTDYEGRWEKDGDILKVNVPFWGGTHVQEWKITSTSGNTLQVEVISEDRQMDGNS